MRHPLLALFLGISLMTPAFGQQAVPVGAGSYAEFSPAHEAGNPVDMATRTIYVTGTDRQPLPTNDWWTDLLASRYAGALWAYPLALTADAQGVDVYFPTEFNGDGTHMMKREPLEVQGTLDAGGAFAPLDARAHTWSDWLVTFRMAQDAGHFVDVTIGHGLPCAWFEFTGVRPRIVLGSARYFNDANATLTLPVTVDHLGVEYAGRAYGIFAPDGTTFSSSGGALSVSFGGAEAYLAVAALPAASALATLNAYAYAIPRQSTLEWSFDPDAGAVATTWTVETEPLKGSNTAVLQGWIPHHYRTTTHDLAFNGVQYRTPRGQLKCAPGNTFHIAWPFRGVLPVLPAPAESLTPNPFDATRMEHYLDMASTVTQTAADTYWGGKDIERMARYLSMAQQLHSPNEPALRDHLGSVLRNWFTYTPGETEFYFAAYPRWGGLVGFNESYNSGAFTDVHFHYGYHVTCAALLGMSDPQFLADYGAMATLVAKAYANWDRTDTRFPFLRTFDPWIGFSYAAGLSGTDGNNQESSSESIQSWGGLFLLGALLGDDDMQAAGAMGYALESSAVDEYWMDYQGYLYGLGNGNFSPIYRWPIAGIVNNQGQLHQTYFSPDPAWVRGIQWIPTSPFLNFLVKDPDFAAWHYDHLVAERDVWAGAGGNDLATMGTDIANLLLGYVQMYDPEWTAAQLDALWSAGNAIATDNYTAGIVYYFTHGNRELGALRGDAYTSIPTSQVYAGNAPGGLTCVIYNPRDSYRLAKVHAAGAIAGVVLCPPRQLVRTSDLLPAGGPFDVLATVPADGSFDVPAATAQVAIAFSRPVDADTLGGITISGPGVAGLELSLDDTMQLATGAIVGTLAPGAEYLVAVPGTLASADGASLPGPRSFAFTVEQGPGGTGSYLRAHYRLDETAGGTAADSAGHGLDGLFRNGAALGRPGAAGFAVELDGVDDYVELPSAALLGLRGVFTVTAWVQLDHSSGEQALVGTDATANRAGLRLGLRDGKPLMSFTGEETLGTASIAPGAWHHLAFRYFHGEQAIFVDGSLDTASRGHAGFLGAGPVLIGRCGGDGTTPHLLAGAVDDVQFYTRPLTAGEIAALHDAPGVATTAGWQNMPPVVDAGRDQVVRFGAAATLAGSVWDDGLPNPPGDASLTWTLHRGPGEVSFADGTSAATTATFGAPGPYVLRLVANDGEFTSYADLAVTVTADLVAHYPLDETQGTTAYDASASGLDGTFVGAPALGQGGAQPGTLFAVDFNGSQEVNLGTPALLANLVNNFTIAAWIRPDAVDGTRIIFGAGWQDYNGWSLRLVGGQLALERLGPTQLYSAGVTIPTGAWTHVAAAYGADNSVSFYRNGALVATVAGSAPAAVCTRPWYIASNGTAERIDGRIDDVQLYGRALSAAEIAYLYAHPGTTFGTTPSAGDPDGDGRIDLGDYAELAACLAGDGADPIADAPRCRFAFDFDRDDDVDLHDFAAFQRLFTGP